MDEPIYHPESDFIWLASNGDVPLAGSELADHNLRRLIAFMSDSDVSNRDWATMTLAMQDIDTVEVREALLKATKDVDACVRAEALEGLAQRDISIALPLIALELQNIEDCAWPTFEAARLVGDPALIPHLQSWIGRFSESWIENALHDAIAACSKRISR